MEFEYKNILLKIEMALSDLRPSEQKVAQYVLENPKEVIYQTVSELASHSDVSEATVMRFVKRLGFQGFQFFKLSLASMPNEEEPYLEPVSYNSNDYMSAIKENVKDVFYKSIIDTYSMLDSNNLKNAVEGIINAKNLILVGVGASGVNARLLGYRLLRMGINASYISDPHLQAMRASLLSSEDLVIGISQSGSTIDTVSALKVAQGAGAKTICITDHAKSPIVKYSDILLYTNTKDDPLGITQGRTVISQIYVIETLTAYLYTKVKETANQARKATARSVLDKLY